MMGEINPQEFGQFKQIVTDLNKKLEDLSDQIKTHTDKVERLLEKHEVQNGKEMEKIDDRLKKLENWRWMVLGMGVAVGSLAGIAASFFT